MSAPATPAPAPQVITAHEAAVVCHHFGLGGYPGSDFSAALVALMAAADWTNLGRLALGFPGWVAAVHLANGDQSAVARLVRIAQQTDTT